MPTQQRPTGWPWRAVALLLLAMLASIASAVFLRGERGALAGFQDQAADGKARALLMLHRESRPLLGARERMPDDAFRAFQKTQEALLKSPGVISAALSDSKAATLPILKQADDPVDWVARRLRVAFEGDTMTVWFTAGSPADQALLVNAIVDAHLNRLINRMNFERREAMQKSQITLKTHLAELQQLRERKRAIEDSAGIEPGDHGQRAGLSVEDLERRRLETRLQKAALAARKEAFENRQGEDARAALETLAIELSAIEAQDALLASEIEQKRAKAAARTGPGTELLALLDQIQAQEWAVRRMAEQVAILKADMNAPPSVELIEHAAAR